MEADSMFADIPSAISQADNHDYGDDAAEQHAVAHSEEQVSG